MPAAARIHLVVFDWAGTVVDFGSRAPVAAFVEAFAAHGVAVTATETRAPMGLPKRDHLLAMLRLPAVAERWRQVHGRAWNETDVAQLYACFMPLQLGVLDEHSALIPGVLDSVAWLQKQGIRIGTTTGYFREAADRVQAAAARQGFVPEHAACVDDVPAGRPAPWMVFRVMEALGVYPPATVVKIGDTVPDIEEGLHAGAWSVGVTSSGSEVGCGADEFNQLPASSRHELLTHARRKLEGAGAHAVLDTLAELPGLIVGLNKHLRKGEKP